MRFGIDALIKWGLHGFELIGAASFGRADSRFARPAARRFRFVLQGIISFGNGIVLPNCDRRRGEHAAAGGRHRVGHGRLHANGDRRSVDADGAGDLLTARPTRDADGLDAGVSWSSLTAVAYGTLAPAIINRPNLSDQRPLVFGQHLDAELFGLGEFGAGAGPGNDDNRFSSTPSLQTLAPSRSAMALASSRVIFSSVPVNTTVLPATVESLRGFSASRMRDLRGRAARRACGCAPRRNNRATACDHRVADLVERIHFLVRLLVALGELEAGVVKRLPRAIAARQRRRRGLADMPDAERIDETLQRNLAPRLDGR